MPFTSSGRPKLVKTRSGNDANAVAPAQTDDFTQTLSGARTSSSDLLSRQLSSSYEDEIGTAADFNNPLNKRFSKRTSSSALTQDPSFVMPPTSITGFESKRTPSGKTMDSNQSPGLPTDTPANIDVERAISLLQELKKTASPAELVALHRALLPTKEASQATTPQFAAIERHISFTSAAPKDRARSVMPPGLATRSGLVDDPLRTQREAQHLTSAPKQNKDKDVWWGEASAASEIHKRTTSLASTGTAADSNTQHAGAYKAGTLRITNGTASPEPGRVHKLAAEFEPKSKPPQDNRSDVQTSRPNLDSAIKQPPLSLSERRKKQWGMRTTTEPSGPRPLIMSKSLVEKKSTEVITPTSGKRSTTDKSMETKASDNTLPRFGQRIAHRAAHLSTEYTMDCEITTSPFEEESVPFEFLNRLSTVVDREGEKNDGGRNDVDDYKTTAAAANSCEEALLKLNGGMLGESTKQTMIDDDDHSQRVDTQSSRDLASNYGLPLGSHPPTVARKQDSGYNSDASASTIPTSPNKDCKKANVDTKDGSNEIRNPISDLNASNAQEKCRDYEAAEVAHKDAMLTVQDMLDALPSPRLAPFSTPALPVDSVKTPKRTSPLALLKSMGKFGKAGSDCGTETESVASPRSPWDRQSSSQNTSAESTPGSVANAKRRLQKRMPDGVRQQRKGEMEQKPSQSLDFTAQDSSMDLPNGSRPNPRGASTIFNNVPTSRVSADADDEAKGIASTARTTTPSKWRRRAKSLGRKRDTTVDGPQGEQPDTKSTSSSSRRRSKSYFNTGTPQPTLPKIDFGKGPLGADNNKDGDASGVSDFSFSVQSLDMTRSSEEDIDSENFAGPKVFQELPRAKSSQTLKASELSLKKSRDTLSRFATGGRGSPPVTPVSQRTIGTTTGRSVEDFFPDWSSKPASKETRANTQDNGLMTAFPPFENPKTTVPPIPELPADLDMKVTKADQMVAKKLRLSPKASPPSSARNSIDSFRRHNRPPSPREEHQLKTVQGNPDHAAAARESKQDLLAPRDDYHCHRHKFSFEEIPKHVPVPVTAEPPRTKRSSAEQRRSASPRVSASPSHDAQHSGWPGFEKQSTLWRKRHSRQQHAFETTAESQLDLKEAVHPYDANNDQLDSPAIVVSRYITPLGPENIARANRQRSNTAANKALVFPEFEDKENQVPTPPPHVNNISDASFSKIWSSSNDARTAKFDVPRSGSAISSASAFQPSRSPFSSYASSIASSTASSSSRRESGHRTASGNFVAYKPTDAMQAERSRALCLARRSCHIKSEDVAQLGLLNVERPPLPKRSSTEVLDRYSGGLGYGWSRESGFVGSAGSRNASREDLNGEFGGGDRNRKSVKMSEEFGLDLSDVPVFLRKRVEGL